MTLMAESLGITLRDLLPRGIVDRAVEEPDGGAHTDVDAAAALLKVAMDGTLADLLALDASERLAARRARYGSDPRPTQPPARSLPGFAPVTAVPLRTGSRELLPLDFAHCVTGQLGKKRDAARHFKVRQVRRAMRLQLLYLYGRVRAEDDESDRNLSLVRVRRT